MLGASCSDLGNYKNINHDSLMPAFTKGYRNMCCHIINKIYILNSYFFFLFNWEDIVKGHGEEILKNGEKVTYLVQHNSHGRLCTIKSYQGGKHSPHSTIHSLFEHFCLHILKLIRIIL